MTDYTSVFVVVGVLAVVFGVMLYRMCTIVRAGQVGLVFIRGAYRTGIDPGFSLVAVIARVRKVKVGGGANHVLGMLGVSGSEISPDNAHGTVSIDNIRLRARGMASVRSGITVRVISDDRIGEVLVAEEHAHPGGPTVPRPRPQQG